jgi:hypothetical protein
MAAGARFFGFVDDPRVSGLTETTTDGLAAVLMVVGLVIAAGLLLLRRWAWVGTMLWVGATLAGELLLFFTGGDANFVVVALSVAQVFYLNLSDVQGAFARREPHLEGQHE